MMTKTNKRSGNVEQTRQKLIDEFNFLAYQEACNGTAVYPIAVDKLLRDILDECLIPSPASDKFERLAIARLKASKVLGLFYVGLGLGEAGEFQNKLKKILRDGAGTISDEARAGMRKELGGILWYVAQACTELGLQMGEVALENTEILNSRKERGTIQGSGDDR